MDYIIVGKIINTHGIKGEVKIYPLTDNNSRFKDLEYAFIGDKKEKVYIEKSRDHKGLIILQFKEYGNINEVLKYKDEYLYVDKENLVELPDDHYFIFDLIGCEAFNSSGLSLGTITDVIQGPANDVYVLEDSLGKEHLIPAVRQFVKEIDVDSKKMIIDPIEGMIQ